MQSFKHNLAFFKSNELWKNISDVLSFLLPGMISIILVIYALITASLTQTIQDMAIYPNPFPTFQTAPYPLVDKISSPDISAVAAIILDPVSHTILYQKNADFRFSPASTTKIMMALVALDYFHPADVLTIKSMIDSEGSGLDFFPGEQVTFENLLQAALIYSANDAAVAIAQNYPGGEPAFVAAMNAKAQKLHLLETHFGDPDGLDDRQDYTTAKNLVSIAAIAMQNPLFTKIVATKFTDFTSVDGQHDYSIKNRNILLGVQGINGIKTGYTDEAGEVLATSVVKNGHTFYIIVMESKDRFADTLAVLPLLDHVIFVSMNPESH